MQEQRRTHTVSHTAEERMYTVCTVFLLLSSVAHTQSKTRTETQAQVRESRWRRNWQASFHCAPTIQQAFLYHTANMLSPFTHKHTHIHSPLLFLSLLQSSIILSPHRHCRQWEVEWEKVKLICGHVLCYCFNKNSLWTWQLHKYNKEAFGEASIMSPIQPSLQIFCNGSLARISPNKSKSCLWFFLISGWRGRTIMFDRNFKLSW